MIRRKETRMKKRNYGKLALDIYEGVGAVAMGIWRFW